MSGILFVCVCRGVSFVARDVCINVSPAVVATVECYGCLSLMRVPFTCGSAFVLSELLHLYRDLHVATTLELVLVSYNPPKKRPPKKQWPPI